MPWIALGVVVMLGVAACSSSASGEGSAATGDASGDIAEVTTGGLEAVSRGAPVPEDVTLTLFDGSQVTFGDLRGTPVVLNLWQSYCPVCITEMPDFEIVHQDLGDEVRIIGVDIQDTRPEALELAAETGVTYELADDPEGAFFAAFEGLSMPTTVFIDADGVFVKRHSGFLNEEALRDEIDALR